MTETVTSWDGTDYQRRVDERLAQLAAQGDGVHGEADFVASLSPRSVLDAGCGTGRVAAELALRGVDVVGVDVDASMLATAEQQAPHLDWVRCDLADLDLGRTFEVVVMAGNVLLFTPAGTTAAVVAGCARHVAAGGALVAGFALGRGYPLERYDAEAADAGLTPTERYATWERQSFDDKADYAVSVHRRNRCQAPTGVTVAQHAEPRPEPVSRLPEPPCQASTGRRTGTAR